MATDATQVRFPWSSRIACSGCPPEGGCLSSRAALGHPTAVSAAASPCGTVLTASTRSYAVGHPTRGAFAGCLGISTRAVTSGHTCAGEVYSGGMGCNGGM